MPASLLRYWRALAASVPAPAPSAPVPVATRPALPDGWLSHVDPASDESYWRALAASVPAPEADAPAALQGPQMAPRGWDDGGTATRGAWLAWTFDAAMAAEQERGTPGAAWRTRRAANRL